MKAGVLSASAAAIASMMSQKALSSRMLVLWPFSLMRRVESL